MTYLMILGVSIPQDHVNIFATKIELNCRPEIKKESTVGTC
jgi:hypothetical protein